MIDPAKARPGDKVHYVPGHYPEEPKENGIVKEMHPAGHAAYVVYGCNEDWKNYRLYTSCLTFLEDLNEGWVDD